MCREGRATDYVGKVEPQRCLGKVERQTVEGNQSHADYVEKIKGFIGRLGHDLRNGDIVCS